MLAFSTIPVVVIASPFLCSPLVVSLLAPLIVSEDGELAGLLACFVMSCLRCGVGVAMIWMWSCSVVSCRTSVVLPVLLASDRNEEWDGCGEADACPMRGWRLGRHAGSFDVETAGLAA